MGGKHRPLREQLVAGWLVTNRRRRNDSGAASDGRPFCFVVYFSASASTVDAR